MIQTNFAFCSVHASEDIKPIGILLDLSDVAGMRMEICGTLESATPINPESRVLLCIGDKQYAMVFSEVRKEITFNRIRAKYCGEFTVVVA